MAETSVDARPKLYLIASLLLIVLVVLIERGLIGAHVYSMVKSSHDAYLGNFIFEYGKAISRTLVLAVVILGILIQDRLVQIREYYISLYSFKFSAFLIPQFACFLAFYSLTEPAFANRDDVVALQMAWLVVGVLLVLLTLLSLAGPRFWFKCITENRVQILVAVVISSLFWWLGTATQDMWEGFSDLTFTLVAYCLGLVADNIYLDAPARIIGVEQFLVSIDTACSGYEGIGLIIAFASVFLYTFRQDFRFPRALLLFPIGIVAIWLFNIVRITVLILIGTYWSEEIAVDGFHTQAGWIAFILTSLGIMWLAHNSSFLTVAKPIASSTRSNQDTRLAVATLLPLILLLAMTFLTQAFSGQFDWLYPLRVIVVAAAIAYCLKDLDFFPVRCSIHALTGGLAVALLWLLMVERSAETDQAFAQTFQANPSVWVIGWLVFRFVGTVITVPIAEELGFRAYLLCRLSRCEVATRGSIPFSIVGLVASSVAFGLLHGAWIAGTIAGLVYALVRYRSSHIMDAIVAHGITNMIIFGYAVYSGQWSLL